GSRTVDIVVKDTGQGMDPDLVPHVFEPFRQADSSTPATHSGPGLGLALLRQLVELHGGRVRAESAGKDCGSTFTVTLPVTRARGRPELEGEAGTSDASGS